MPKALFNGFRAIISGMMFPRILLFLLLLAVFTGCAASRGVYHQVGKGETLWRISRTYGVDLQEVAEINNIRDTTEIKAGRKIYIPGATRVRKVRPYVPLAPNNGASPEKEKEEDEGRIVIEKDRFSWPVKGEVISPYGLRNGVRHGGIDIKAKSGTLIKAADNGEVVFVNSGMRGYGNIIILKHKDEFFTVYAHNKENHVKVGEAIVKGAAIGAVGDTGNATSTHLHFEVRQGKIGRNPLFFLP